MRKKRFGSPLHSAFLALIIALGAIMPASLSVGAASTGALEGALGGTYFTDDDNWFPKTGETKDLDTGITQSSSQYPIEFVIKNVDQLPKESAHLLVRAFDVDEYNVNNKSGTGEWDRVYMSSSPDVINLGGPYTPWYKKADYNPWPAAYTNWHKEMNPDYYIGALSGNNQTWNTSVLQLPNMNSVALGDNYVGVTVHHYYQNTAYYNAGWQVTVDWAQLIIDGGHRKKAEVTDATLTVANGKATVNTSFLPKESGKYSLEINLIETVNGVERNLVTKKNYVPNAVEGEEEDWSIDLIDASILANKVYKINIILFEDGGGGSSAPSGQLSEPDPTNPREAQHLLSVSTTDPVEPAVKNISKSGIEGAAVSFTADDFKKRFVRLNNLPLGKRLQTVKIVTLPDESHGFLKLNGTDVTPGQEISAGDLGKLTFEPASDFTGTADFKWNGFNGMAYASDDAIVSVTINAAPTAGNVEKNATTGDTITFATADFSDKFGDRDIGDELTSVSFTLPPAAEGVLKLKGSIVEEHKFYPAGDLADLEFIPNPAFEGETVTIGWYAHDGKEPSKTSGTITINYDIKPVVGAITKQNVAQYAPTPLTDSDFRSRFYKPGGQIANGAALQSVEIVSLPVNGKLQFNGTDVTIGQQITVIDLDKLFYIPNGSTGLVGSDSFKWNGSDGANYAAAPATFTITANPAPVVGPITIHVNKGTSPVSFTPALFTDAYTDNEPLTEVTLTGLPTTGQLLLDGVSVTEGQAIPAAQLNKLTFVPDNGQTGTVTFKWSGKDGTQYAKGPENVTIVINAPPVAGLIEKAGLTGQIVSFNADDFRTHPAFHDPDSGDVLTQVKITLPSDFASKGELFYTGVTDAVYLNPGQAATLTPSQLDTLKFAPSAELPNGGTVTFPWIAHDGKMESEQPGTVQISYDGKPVAQPILAESQEGNPTLAITLKGTDDNVTGVVYGIVSNPRYGTLTKLGGDQWIYTPNPGFTGADSFTYIAIDGQGQESAPATVEIRVHKALDGWVGDKGQGGPTPFKALPDAPLKLSAVSSIWADSVIADVNGLNVNLTLANPDTYAADGFKLWTKTVTLAKETTPGSYHVSFQAIPAANQTALAPEPASRLADNDFVVLKTNVALTADPDKIVGDGKTTTELTAKVTAEDGTPLAGVTVKFEAPAGVGTFVDANGNDVGGVITAVTNSEGIAVVTYKSARITGVGEQQVQLSTTVRDVSRGLSAKDDITIVFQPARVQGLLTQGAGHAPIADAKVKIMLDLNGDGILEPGVDFIEDVPLAADGSYSVPVPYGDKIYDLIVTQTVEIGGVETEITFTQKANVDKINGSGENFISEKTATGVVLFLQPDGKSSLLDEDVRANMVVYLKDASGNYISENGAPKAFPLKPQGVFTAEGLAANVEYTLEIRYVAAPGVELVMGTGTVSVNDDGEMNVTQELVDPYGTITDAITGQMIEGAKVTLYYADTARNLGKGNTPNTKVTVPAIPGFAPNDNASPEQLSDIYGFYAYMVYPESDYYLVVTKNGYTSYTSPTLSVEWDIVKHDLQLDPIRYEDSPSESSGYSGYITSGTPDLAMNVSVDKNLIEEGTRSIVKIEYKNQGTASLPNGEVTVTLPEGVKIIDADGGEVKGNTITWKVTNLAAAKGGAFHVTVEWPQLANAEGEFAIPGSFTGSGGSTAAAAANSSVKVRVFSDRFDNLKHQRYILGFPDGEFKPNYSLTRAELAAIVARLTENKKLNTLLPYSDVSEDHWAANYIRIATKYNYFGGYEDGTFRPEAPVSRGELAIVMARYLGIATSAAADPHFSDTAEHWAADAVETLYKGRFLSGYEDGTFKPDAAIIRVEAVTMINRMLFRGPLAGLEPLFPDMPASHWGFGEVQEATFSHEAIRNADGSETWIQSIQDDVQ
ncbi:S-layer homology domain-containing protein [Paenibacillus puerhi]|uniref:S-layer homology domain-containing protein n=1 Tax=Paenibacillus puerhi TaxID=2692622 RepID=UPI00135CB9B8|nr:S-layer homology domain-containing protein [Paenibacillus puerhi]